MQGWQSVASHPSVSNLRARGETALTVLLVLTPRQAFHAAGCPVARFGAATWQCGCQGSWASASPRKASACASPPPSLPLRPRTSAPELRSELSRQALALQEHGVAIDRLVLEVEGLKETVRLRLRLGGSEAQQEAEQEAIESVVASSHEAQSESAPDAQHAQRHDVHDFPSSPKATHRRTRSDDSAATSSPATASSHGTFLSPTREREHPALWARARAETHASASTLATSLGSDSPSRTGVQCALSCCGVHAGKHAEQPYRGSPPLVPPPAWQPHAHSHALSQSSSSSLSTARPRVPWIVDSRTEQSWPPPPLLPPRGSSLGLPDGA